jgi:hypothetical protein
VLRPQEISNHPEVIRRLGLITINTALECDIYGNVNSTHVGGTHMMNGIGGSGDFARNAHLSVFVTKAAPRTGRSRASCRWSRTWITPSTTPTSSSPSTAWPTCAAWPRERARQIIDNCADPLYRDMLRDYFRALPPRRPHAAAAAGGLCLAPALRRAPARCSKAEPAAGPETGQPAPSTPTRPAGARRPRAGGSPSKVPFDPESCLTACVS